MSNLPSDTPAVVGAVRSAAQEAQNRYVSLGCGPWAQEQAEVDADRSIRALEIFFKGSRLAWTLSEPERQKLHAYYSDLWMSGWAVPVLKWAIAFPLSTMSGVLDGSGERILCETLPKPSVLANDTTTSALQCIFPWPCGPGRVLRTRLHERANGRPSKRARNLAWSLCDAKSLFPPMWVDRVSASLREHADLLSASSPRLPSRIRETLQLVGASIARLVQERYSNRDRQIVRYSDLPRPRLSSSAGWVKMYDKEAHRVTTMAGTRSAVHQRLSSGLGQGQELHSMRYTPTSGLQVFRQIPYEFDWADWDFVPRVSIVALQEPFKIRTISIADGPVTAAASPLQRAWHSVLRELRPFQLIGGERVVTAVDDRIRHLWPGCGWVSGDYSAATDRLSSRASRIIWSELTKGLSLPPVLRARMETSLFSAELDYSRTLDPFKGRAPQELLDSIKLPEVTQQKNGQLMGCILSFPILCLVNLAGWLASYHDGLGPDGPGIAEVERPIRAMLALALERGYFTREELDQFPVLINGDDILFQATPDHYQRWISSLPSLGLKPSVGKNYFSDEFFTINSELYTREGYQSRPWWAGFETELVRLRNELKFEIGEDVLTADLRRVLPKMQEFLRSTVPERHWPSFNRLWLDHLRLSDLLSPYKGLNWFIPVELGGMGLDSTGAEDGYVTYAQRKLLARAALDPLGFKQLSVSVETSLLNDDNIRRLRSTVNSQWLVGEPVRTVGGRSYLLDLNRAPGEDGAVRAFETVTSFVQHSSHIDSWLDYNITGVRLDVERVQQSVVRMLHWGLRLSDKHLVEDYDVVERHQCLRRPTWLVPVDDGWQESFLPRWDPYPFSDFTVWGEEDSVGSESPGRPDSDVE